MILNEFYRSVLYEQETSVETPPQDQEAVPQETAPQEQEQDVNQVPEPASFISNPQLVPLKKVYLISKLNDLKTQLEKQNIVSDELNTILKFADSFSYDILLNLSDSVIEIVKFKVSRGVVSDEPKK